MIDNHTNKMIYENLLEKGINLYLCGQYEEAIKCFDKLIELDPTRAEAYFQKGRSLLSTY